MSKPTGKLAFAHQTIANLECKVEQLTEELKVAQSMHVDAVRWIWEERGFGHCSEMAEKFDALVKLYHARPEVARTAFVAGVEYQRYNSVTPDEIKKRAEQYAASIRSAPL